MPSVAADVPAEKSILCEGCGYTLDGLPTTTNCPECGKPVRESAADDLRRPPPWEAGKDHRVRRLLLTTARVMFVPTRFFRSLTTREPEAGARSFAQIQWAMTSLLFASAAGSHLFWYLRYIFYQRDALTPVWFAYYLGMAAVSWVFLAVVNYLALRLTIWEARYRGIRLPRVAVYRALCYHAAHYLPVGLVAAATTAGNAILIDQHVLGAETAITYLWILSAEVVLAAVYLFTTYWTAMRNIMYANR